MHSPVLSKIYNVPKKNTDKLKNKSIDFKLQKYRILNKLFEILKFISECKENKSNRSISENEELMKTILVRIIFLLSNLFPFINYSTTII
jgi:hypothetical protein